MGKTLVEKIFEEHLIDKPSLPVLLGFFARICLAEVY